jgi:hypothetical protein
MSRSGIEKKKNKSIKKIIQTKQIAIKRMMAKLKIN